MASEANDQRRAPRRATRRDERGGSLTGPREADLRGRPEAPRTRPANENDAGASMAAAALRRRPSTSAFWAAFAVSLLWIVLCTVVMFIPIGAGLPSPLQGTGMAGLAAALIAITLPILLIWAAAYLLWRAQQIQNVSEALMHAARRLIRPHEVTSDGVTTIAQTIRQEIEQLVGGIEHAVNRAGELSQLADALTGKTPAGITCSFRAPTQVASTKAIATSVTDDLPVRSPTTADRTVSVPGASWATAAWFVANADRLGIDEVGYAARTWNRGHGWSTSHAPSDAVVANVHQT